MSLNRVTAATLSLAGLCAASAGNAAERSPNWSGFYAGALVGYGFGKAPTGVTPNEPASSRVWVPYLIPDREPTPRGITGGIEAGYQHQFGRVVAGVVTDLSFASMKSTDSAAGPSYVGGTLVTTIESKLNWYGSLRAKLGLLPSENVLIYATGGLAYADISTTTTASNLAGCPGHYYCSSGTASGVTTGFIYGGGIEYALHPRWTLKAEYLATRFKSQSVTFAEPEIINGLRNGAYTADTSFKFQTVRLGVAYKFGP